MGGYHDDLLLCQPHALLGRHDDVLVVGQHEHDLAGGVVHLPQNGLRRGIHGLAAGYHPVHAQIPEGCRQSVSGAYRQKAVALLGGDLRLLGLLQLRLDGVQIVGALGVCTTDSDHSVFVLFIIDKAFDCWYHSKQQKCIYHNQIRYIIRHIHIAF